jgi:hemerythrin
MEGVMFALKWSDELGTGIEMIDVQHREFCRRVNAFLKVCAETPGDRDHLVETFNYLRVYVLEHFGLENSLMEEFDYPRKKEHMRDHEQTRAWVEETARLLPSIEINANFILDLTHHLVEWTELHFRRVDRQLSQYLQELGQHSTNHRLHNFLKGIWKKTD